jgi:hypothetical protein
MTGIPLSAAVFSLIELWKVQRKFIISFKFPSYIHAHAQRRQPHHTLHLLVIRKRMGGQEGGPQLVVGVRPGLPVKHVPDETNRIGGQRRQHVVIASDRIRHVAERELPFRETKPRNRVLRPEGRKFDLLLLPGNRGASRWQRWLRFVILQDENSGSPMLRSNDGQGG